MATGTDSRHRRLVLGGRAHLEAALAEWITSAKGADPLREVIVVTGSNLACGHLSRSLAGRLGAHAGVRFLSIHALAPALAAERLECDGLRVLSPLLRERLVAALVARRADQAWYFGPVARTPGLPRALSHTIDDLREAGVPVGALAAVRSRKVADLAALYGDYVAALQRRRLVDDAGLYALAAHAAAHAASPARPGVPIALFGLYDLPAMQSALVAALAADRPFAAFLPWVDGVRRYAAPARALLESLGLEFDEPVDGPGPRADGTGLVADAGFVADGPQLAFDVGRPGPNGAAPGAGAAQSTAEVRIVSVADDVAERRAVVAALLQAAAQGVAFHEMAVVVADRAGRDRLAGALQAQAVPVAARRANDGVSARTCRLLLDCLLPVAGRSLRREAVIDLAATAPRLSVGADTATVALWDDLSRRARIVADDEWNARLRRLEYSLTEHREGEGAESGAFGAGRQSGGASGASRGAPHEAAAAASLREFAGRLGGLRRRVIAARTWPQATAIFLDGARRLCGVRAADPVLLALAELADVALVDDADPRESFADVARRALSSLETATEQRVARDGVALLSPQQMRGLSFRVVVFCDLAEGGFPPRPAPDPVLLDGEREALAVACGARLPGSAELPDEHDALFALARTAALERLVLVYPRRDASTGRPRLPSRALLGLARELVGGPVAFEELDTEGGCGGAVRRVGGEFGEPVDLRDFDLAVLSLAAGRRDGRPAWLEAYAAAVLGTARTERGAAAAAGRRRAALGPYDGVLSPERAARAAAAVFAAPVSPSALQSYLSCPFAFYLRYVLGLEVPDEPDEALSIEPVDLGSLAHEILQGAYAVAVQAGVPSKEAVLAGLDEVARRAFARAEARGLTGFPLSWRVVSDELLADLRRIVATDPCWDDGLMPARFEWSFGGPAAPATDAESPAAVAPELQVGDRLVRFRGRVDRLDASPDRRRVRLVDYKTGRGANETERVAAGRDVQLPVYVLALLATGERAPESLVAEYRMVRRRSGFARVPLPGEPDEVRESLAATLAIAVAGIEGGLFPRWPDRGCAYCDVAASCGVDRIAFAAKRHDPRLRALVRFKEPAGAVRKDAL
jgi:RecB family exonuclease